MMWAAQRWKGGRVALLAEGVDRNLMISVAALQASVALLAEGVDRNCIQHRTFSVGMGRPPRGGRG